MKPNVCLKAPAQVHKKQQVLYTFHAAISGGGGERPDKYIVSNQRHFQDVLDVIREFHSA
jgi:hypothetical protein